MALRKEIQIFQRRAEAPGPPKKMAQIGAAAPGDGREHIDLVRWTISEREIKLLLVTRLDAFEH
jgi:hypothetical protein